MPGKGLVIENSEMNKTWVDVSRLVRKFTCELGKEKGNGVREVSPKHML